jgi:hypothetical protein
VVAWLGDQASWLASMVTHTVFLMVLALVPTLGPGASDEIVVTSLTEQPVEEIDAVPVEMPVEESFDHTLQPDSLDHHPTLDEQDVHADSGAAGPGDVPPEPRDDPTDSPDMIIPLPGDRGNDGPGTRKEDTKTGDDIGDRIARRKRSFGPNGPTPDSEKAVDDALRWLAAHQLADGSWSFDHRAGDCQGRCQNHGSYAQAKAAATALGILPFLGAGQTHLEGRYQKTVADALRYLLATQKIDGNTGQWRDAVANSGGYSHGLATLAVCEAYAMAQAHKARPKTPPKSPSEMTEEERRQWREQRKRPPGAVPAVSTEQLGRAAQLAINDITAAQHAAGGWRYAPGQEGDTSVVGWMLMALKSGHLANLRVQPAPVIGASKFLTSVSGDDYGSIYHYMADKQRPVEQLHATTAIGLLCRMYLGWSKDHPGIGQGVQNLGAWGPSTGGSVNMYYNYYATQVMHHYGGDPWKKWNLALRDFLVKSQAQEGHAQGSWYFQGDHGSGAGGRLYVTALAAMTLEVYYRYLPIYDQRSVEDDLVVPPKERKPPQPNKLP